MELSNGRPTTDFVVGTYTYDEINDEGFMHIEEQRAHEELRFRGYEFNYKKTDSHVNGQFVRVFRVWTDEVS